MAGTTEGGKKAAATNIKKHGLDFYREIGRKGGRAGHTGGFAANPELAKRAGAIGGRISRRGAAVKNAVPFNVTLMPLPCSGFQPRRVRVRASSAYGAAINAATRASLEGYSSGLTTVQVGDAWYSIKDILNAKNAFEKIKKGSGGKK